MNLAYCYRLPVRREKGVWYRALQLRFLSSAASTAYTKKISSRFNVGKGANPQYRILYLAENQQVALFEVQALFGSPMTPGGIVAQPRSAWAVLNLPVDLQQVADLTAAVQHGPKKLETSAQELTGDWRGYQLRSLATSITGPTGVAPTQELGAALYAVPDLEGFRTYSAKLPDQMVLVVFPDKLQAGSFVEFIDPATGQTIRVN